MKETILKNIKKNRPMVGELPEIPSFDVQEISVAAFVKSLEEAEAKVVLPDTKQSLSAIISANYPDAKHIINTTSGKQSNASPKKIHPLDLAIIRGTFGVIENGAIWIDEDSLGIRAVPFLAEHLIIMLPAGEIVGNMHQAYQRLEKDDSDYGIFVAGPSKTADIEQCLVIGAQGAKSLLVVLT